MTRPTPFQRAYERALAYCLADAIVERRLEIAGLVGAGSREGDQEYDEHRLRRLEAELEEAGSMLAEADGR